jgi:hypothetical protein
MILFRLSIQCQLARVYLAFGEYEGFCFIVTHLRYLLDKNETEINLLIVLVASKDTIAY